MLKVKTTICALLAMVTASSSVLFFCVAKNILFALPFSWLSLSGFICGAYLALQGTLGILWSLDRLIGEEKLMARLRSEIDFQPTGFGKKLLKVFLNSYPK